MAENGRLGDTEKVIDGFKQLMSAHRGEVEVTVTTAAVSSKPLVLVHLLEHGTQDITVDGIERRSKNRGAMKA